MAQFMRKDMHELVVPVVPAQDDSIIPGDPGPSRGPGILREQYIIGKAHLDDPASLLRFRQAVEKPLETLLVDVQSPLADRHSALLLKPFDFAFLDRTHRHNSP